MKLSFLSLISLLFCIKALALNFTSLSIEQSLALAALEDKYILVSFSAPWCLPCSIMKSGPYRDPNVIMNVEKDYIAVAVNIDDVSRREWVQKYNIDVLPTHLILDKNNNVITQMVGIMNTSQFSDFIVFKTAPLIHNEELKNIEFPTINLYSNVENYADNMENKIYLDGILVDINNSFPDQPFLDQQIKVSPATEFSEKVENTIENEVLMIIQLGAFPSLLRAQSHQKSIKLKIRDATEVMVDHSTPRLPYKLVMSSRFSLSQANLEIAKLKSRGIDCFIRDDK